LPPAMGNKGEGKLRALVTPYNRRRRKKTAESPRNWGLPIMGEEKVAYAEHWGRKKNKC